MRNKDPNQRIRELEAEIVRMRTAHEAQLTCFTAAIEDVRRQASARRAPATVFIGRLTQSEVNAKIRKREIGTFYDGGNLELQIRFGAKPESEVIASWVFSWTQTLRPGVYKHRTIGLRSARMVSLEDARRKAHQFREMLAEGKDPKVEQLNMLCDEQTSKNCLRTLEQAAEEFIEAKIKPKSPGYAQRLQQLLRDNILIKEHKLGDHFVKVGTLPIQRVTQAILLEESAPDQNSRVSGCGFKKLWNEQYPSARDLHSILDRIYGFARHKGYYIGNSPMAWRGCLEHVLPDWKDVHTVKHYSGRALTVKNAPRFLQEHLRKHQYRREWPNGTGPDGRPINCYMIELVLLTGARVGEIIGATWGQLDYTTMTWTVPPENTKRKDVVHRMPITRSAAAIFDLMQQMRTDLSPNAPIFPSHHKRWKQSHNRVGSQTLMRVVRQLAPEFGESFVNHGFRTTLKDWCRINGYSDPWYEEQVHHKEQGKTKQAYGHDDLLDQRRIMMAAWDSYLNTKPLPAKEATNIITLRSKRRTG